MTTHTPPARPDTYMDTLYNRAHDGDDAFVIGWLTDLLIRLASDGTVYASDREEAATILAGYHAGRRLVLPGVAAVAAAAKVHRAAGLAE